MTMTATPAASRPLAMICKELSNKMLTKIGIVRSPPKLRGSLLEANHAEAMRLLVIKVDTRHKVYFGHLAYVDLTTRAATMLALNFRRPNRGARLELAGASSPN